MKKNKKRGIFIVTSIILLLILIVSLFMVYFLLGQKGNLKKKGITDYVQKNYEVLESYVNGSTTFDKIPKFTFLNQNPDRGQNEKSSYVKFQVSKNKNKNITCENGFYYSEKDVAHRYEYASYDIRKIDETHFRVSETDLSKKNHMDIYFIRNHWYYYEYCDN